MRVVDDWFFSGQAPNEPADEQKVYLFSLRNSIRNLYQLENKARKANCRRPRPAARLFNREQVRTMFGHKRDPFSKQSLR